MQKGRLPNRGRKVTPDEECAEGAAPQATSISASRQGMCSEEVIDLEARSSEADVAQPGPQRRMRHPSQWFRPAGDSWTTWKGMRSSG
eukprot:3712402-Pyramimonas_sp.AAC.2